MIMRFTKGTATRTIGVVLEKFKNIASSSEKAAEISAGFFPGAFVDIRAGCAMPGLIPSHGFTIVLKRLPSRTPLLASWRHSRLRCANVQEGAG